MGRKRKNSASVLGNELVEEKIETPPETVEEDLEYQDERQPSLIAKARGILASGVNNVQDKLGVEPDRKRKKWVPKEKRQEQESNIATLITSLLVMLLAGWKVPDELKPSEDEVTAVSGFGVSILLRHVDISGRLTAGAIDVIGIVAVTAGYISRTSKLWGEYKITQEANRALKSDEIKENISSDTPKTIEASNVPPLFPSAI